MATIVFAIADSISHYNASYKIANKLRNNGHRIVYIGDSKKREKEATSQGFEFEVIYNDFFKNLGNSSGKGLWNRLKQFRAQIQELRRYKQALLQGAEIKDLVERVKPDLFIIDVFHVLHAVALYRFGIKTVLLQTYVATDKDPYIPPLNSGLIPKKTWWHYLAIEFLWLRYFCVRSYYNFVNNVLLFGQDKNSIFKTLVRETKFPEEHINYNRAFHLGIKSTPELILCAREFDFPRNVKANQHFVGPMVEFERRDVLYDQKYLDVIFQMEVEALSDESNVRPIVYCSLGTLNVSWYKYSEQFFRTLISAFEKRKDYLLFISVGTDISLERFKDVPENVYVFQLVPQIDILERASVMITHGGINSINECIFSGVPMVVYPLSRQIDQHGNAARVEYHGLGIRGNIKTETEKGILHKTDCVINDPSYKNNVLSMKEVYKNYQHAQGITELIEAQLVA